DGDGPRDDAVRVAVERDVVGLDREVRAAGFDVRRGAVIPVAERLVVPDVVTACGEQQRSDGHCDHADAAAAHAGLPRRRATTSSRTIVAMRATPRGMWSH